MTKPKILRPIEQYKFREVKTQKDKIAYFEVYDRYTNEVMLRDESFIWCIDWIMEEEIWYLKDQEVNDSQK
ncbi:hypothetical protein [Leptospira alexanderi]|uniref:hypothetical protein n=1 Tax=Leptospira alexanderi TaxID=100053 RepID=UPI0011157EE5|nr:hypothetical protein [Leptospira alexanderi]